MAYEACDQAMQTLGAPGMTLLRSTPSGRRPG
jgi:hypothetical protein